MNAWRVVHLYLIVIFHSRMSFIKINFSYFCHKICGPMLSLFNNSKIIILTWKILIKVSKISYLFINFKVVIKTNTIHISWILINRKIVTKRPTNLLSRGCFFVHGWNWKPWQTCGIPEDSRRAGRAGPKPETGTCPGPPSAGSHPDRRLESHPGNKKQTDSFNSFLCLKYGIHSVHILVDKWIL